MSDEERYEKVIQTWNTTTEKIADELMDSLGSLNNLFIMAHSGARGSKNQIKQVGGMRGLMANASGKTIEIPITANFRERSFYSGLLHLLQRRPEGAVRYGSENSRFRIPDETSRRCQPQCDRKGDRLRHR